MEHISSLQFHTVCFDCMLSSGLSKYIETNLETTSLYLIQSYFKKQKQKKVFSLSHFPHNFWRKIFPMLDRLLKDRRIVHRVTTSDNEWHNEWQRMTTSGATNDNEWQRVVQRMTMSGNEWYNEWQRMTCDNEWQQMTTNENEWQ